MYKNQGGKITLVESWSKCDTYETERKIHGHAKRLGASEVRIDASGIGGAVFDHLDIDPAYADRPTA